MMYSTREISLDVMRKPARNKGKHIEGQHTETSGSAREHDWVVGLQILTTSIHLHIPCPHCMGEPSTSVGTLWNPRYSHWGPCEEEGH